MNSLASCDAVQAVQLRAAPGLERLEQLLEEHQSLESIDAILDEVTKFSQRWLTPLNRIMDRHGCKLVDGRVETAPGHKAAWQAFREAGWTTLDKPCEHGGQDLPLVAWAACQEVFDRCCVAFGMPASLLSAATRLIATHAEESLQADWLPKLSSGEWGATICISESDAGSDVGRIRTMAVPSAAGDWSITGEKMWISFGDHDLTDRIGHCLLARTPDAPDGGPGLSLFLVPDWNPDGSRNNVHVRRIEEKLGLHGSPTCALGFEQARGHLIGTIGRGLPQLFAMITFMRLSVGIQGLGIAADACETALAYSAERRQGGKSSAAPVTIDSHADVQRMLMRSIAHVEVLRGLVYAAAVQADLAKLETNRPAAAEAAALTQWLLPIIKTLGGETGLTVANDAIQILGGAGYVEEWGVAQALRDARIFTIYEGTTGMQALDLLHRRLWREEGAGLNLFAAMVRRDTAAQPLHSEPLGQTIDLLERTGQQLLNLRSSPRDAEAGATHFLNLAGLAATGWIAHRLASLTGSGPAVDRLRAAGRYWLSDLVARATLESAQSVLGARRLELFSLVKAP